LEPFKAGGDVRDTVQAKLMELACYTRTRALAGVHTTGTRVAIGAMGSPRKSTLTMIFSSWGDRTARSAAVFGGIHAAGAQAVTYLLNNSLPTELGPTATPCGKIALGLCNAAFGAFCLVRVTTLQRGCGGSREECRRPTSGHE